MNYQQIYKNATDEQRAQIDQLEEIMSDRSDEHAQAQQEVERWQQEERRTFRQYDRAETALHVYMESLMEENQ